MFNEPVRLDRKVSDKTTLKPRPLHRFHLEMSRPGVAISSEKLLGAGRGSAGLRAERLGPDGLDLRPDELPALGLTVFLQPIGIHEASGIVVGVRVDRGE